MHVVSDLRVPLTGATVTARATWNHGQGAHEWTWGGDIDADTVARVGRMSLIVPDAPGELLVDLVLDSDDHSATNRYRSRIIR